VFWFNRRYPLQFYDATSQMQILPRHIFGSVPADSIRAFVASSKPVGSGRYRFVNWKPAESIELAADTVNYRGAPNINRLIWRIMPSATSATKALFAGEADISDAMRP
jgi:peptide/nickel transport system substrate-binding protein